MPELAEWDSFYVIVGSSAGALVGLQFVVLTLLAERPPERLAEAGAAFATPTIVHFTAVLLLSAGIRAPWHSLTTIAALWGLGAVAGLAYGAVAIRRMRRQTAYRPGVEDWVFYAALPLVAYGVLAASAWAARSHAREALFGVGASMLLLLLVGIHNAWDTVSYHVLTNPERGGKNRP